MAKVLFGCPTLGSIRMEAADALVRAVLNQCGHEIVGRIFQVAKPIDSCRNMIIKAFLEETDADILWMMDSDNGPVKPVNVMEMVDKIESGEADIVGFPTPLWKSNRFKRGQNPMIWNVYMENYTKDAWSPMPRPSMDEDGRYVDAVGTGCFMVHRKVLAALHPPFCREWDKDGIMTKGSDLLFCKRARQLGFRVWVAWNHPCGHVKSADLLDIYKAIDIRDIKHAGKPNINTPEYWDGQWGTREPRHYPQYDFICDWLREKDYGDRKPRVLDFGCGRGDLLAMLWEIGDASGVDISQTGVDICKGLGLNARKIPEDWMPDDGEYWDVIVATEVFEHLDDVQTRARQLLTHCDVLVYSVPNDSLPPGLEPEHRGVWNYRTAKELTPGYELLIKVHKDEYFTVIVDKANVKKMEGDGDGEGSAGVPVDGTHAGGSGELTDEHGEGNSRP